MDGRVDNTHEDAFTHTVRLADDDRALEVARRRAAVADLRRSARRVSPRWPGEVGAVAGRGVRAAGRRPDGRRPHAAGRRAARRRRRRRAGRRRHHRGRPARPAGRQAAAGDGRARDRRATRSSAGCSTRPAGSTCPNSCFTYSAGRARAVRHPHRRHADGAGSLQPPARARRGSSSGARWRGWSAPDGRLRLFHSMHDNVHGFELTYEIDLASGTVDARRARDAAAALRRHLLGAAAADHRAARRARRRRPAQAHPERPLGGEGGCAQLYDLTADLLKLLA